MNPLLPPPFPPKLINKVRIMQCFSLMVREYCYPPCRGGGGEEVPWDLSPIGCEIKGRDSLALFLSAVPRDFINFTSHFSPIIIIFNKDTYL
jgi:hypothetical protein